MTEMQTWALPCSQKWEQILPEDEKARGVASQGTRLELRTCTLLDMAVQLPLPLHHAAGMGVGD